MEKRERVISLCSRIAGLKNKMTELETELDKLLGEFRLGVKPGSEPSQVLNIVDAEPGRIFRARDFPNLSKTSQSRYAA